MVKFVDLGVLYFSLVLPREPTLEPPIALSDDGLVDIDISICSLRLVGLRRLKHGFPEALSGL